MENNETFLDNDMKEIIDSFVSESIDLVEDSESRLMKLENQYEQEDINTIFRMFHSIKGTAGFLNFEIIKNVTHTAETMLDIFRKNTLMPDNIVIELLYSTCDFLKKMIAFIADNAHDKCYEDEAKKLTDAISDEITLLKKEISPETQTPANANTTAAPLTFGKLNDNTASLLEQIEKDFENLKEKPTDFEQVNSILAQIKSLILSIHNTGIPEVKDICEELENKLDTSELEEGKITTHFFSEITEAVEILKKTLHNLTDKAQDQTAEQAQLQKKNSELKKIGELLVEMGEITSETLDDALSSQQKTVGEILIEKGKVSKTAVEKAYEIQKKNAQEKGLNIYEVHRKDIRVNTSKLDKLFDLVGELITAEVMVYSNPDLQGQNLENFNKAANNLSKITRDLQETATSIRMIPLEGLFTRMKRLVRDLSHKSEKDVNFSVAGEDTEMDRNIIELISDPLVHIIRNSIDHGLENQEERLAKKKRKEGNIGLSARYEGNEIWISIEDDGKGLDREKILEKARKNNLFNGGQEELSDRQVWQFVFEPGFSTAEKITEVSGRGVGMDVVKRNIEKIGGKIDIISEKGQGTCIILKIPLTLAIMDGITLRIGQNFYSLPIVDVLEFFKANLTQLVMEKDGHQVIRIREEVLPVIRLDSLFHLNNQSLDISDGIMVVVQNNHRKACFMVDEVVGNFQIVVKSLSQYLGRAKGVSGCTVMGNGDVSMILDTGSILEDVIH